MFYVSFSPEHNAAAIEYGPDAVDPIAAINYALERLYLNPELGPFLHRVYGDAGEERGLLLTEPLHPDTTKEVEAAFDRIVAKNLDRPNVGDFAPHALVSHLDEEIRSRRVNAAVETASRDVEEPPETVWYLSFVDPGIYASLPEGEQTPGGPSWRGGCFVRASDERAAVAVAHAKGINPGGEAAITGPIELAHVRPEYLERLLTDPDDVQRAGRDG